MRQIIRFPKDKRYKFGLTHGGGLEVKAGDFVTEEEVKTYEVGEQFLEPKGEEKENWDNELPEGTDRIVFSIEATIEGRDKEEKERMVSQFMIEFKDYIRTKGVVIFKVIDVKVVKKRKKKE